MFKILESKLIWAGIAAPFVVLGGIVIFHQGFFAPVFTPASLESPISQGQAPEQDNSVNDSSGPQPKGTSPSGSAAAETTKTSAQDSVVEDTPQALDAPIIQDSNQDSKDSDNADTEPPQNNTDTADTNKPADTKSVAEQVKPVQINSLLVINEVRPQGKEFVELYNPTDTPTSLAGYYFTYYSHSKMDWAAATRIKQFPDDAVISPYKFYLIAFGDSSFSSPVQDWLPYTTNTLSNSAGTIALYAGDPRSTSQNSTRIDAFGWGDTKLFEFAPMKIVLAGDQAFARPINRAGMDANNNSFDFRATTVATPGKINILVDPQNDPSLHSATVSEATIAPAQVVISEALINGAEFVELYNPTDQAQSLQGHYLAYFNSSKTAWNDALSAKEFSDSAAVPAGGYFLVDLHGGNYPDAQWTPDSFSQLSNSAGTVAIFSADPNDASTSVAAQAALVDAVGWGNVSLEEGQSTQVPGAGQSLSRDMNNDDSNDNSVDFEVGAPTPGEASSWQPQDNTTQDDSSQTDNAPVLSDVVINEVEVADNEFVELYNPSDEAVDLSGYFFAYYSSSKTAWNDPYRIKPFPSDATIAAKGYYLIGLKGTANGDWQPQPYTTSQLSDTGGTVAIFAEDPKTADQTVCDILPTDAVAWGDDSKITLKETTTAQAPPAGESISRDSSHDDTDDNSADFAVLPEPTPTNSGMPSQ